VKKIKRALYQGLVFTTVMLAGSALSLADTIKLKNGSVIKGKVIAFSQQEFTVVLDLGPTSRRSTTRLVIAAVDVESIEFDSAETLPPASSSIPSAPPSSLGAKRGELEPVASTPTRSETALPQSPAVSPAISSGAGTVLAEKTVSVAAAADWTSTEIRVQRGQRISITASGEVDLGNNRRADPDGISLEDAKKLLPQHPTGALIAVIGDDNDDFIFVGRAAEFVAPHNGILFLSVNEGNLKDNSGSFLARVKVMANP
jgi:hypothetical protein